MTSGHPGMAQGVQLGGNRGPIWPVRWHRSPRKERTCQEGDCRAFEGVGEGLNNISQQLLVDFLKTLPHYVV